MGLPEGDFVALALVLAIMLYDAAVSLPFC